MTTKKDSDHVWEIVGKIKTCMLVTRSKGRMRSRPVHAMADREVGCLWFITDQRGAKDDEIKSAPEVCLCFADTASNMYLSMTGRAEMLRDVSKARKLWRTETQAWWP
jgi:general stress protein 26